MGFCVELIFVSKFFAASQLDFSLGWRLFFVKLMVYSMCLSVGSGSSYLYGFFDQAWKEGMSKEEAEVCVLIPTVAISKLNSELRTKNYCRC